MNKKISVCDVVWDGTHFTAFSAEGTINGHGSFKQNKKSTGGVIEGQICDGPEEFVGKDVRIDFDGQLGVCALV